jgi:ABC-type multidrug transport system fused ATPase/permease subunit
MRCKAPPRLSLSTPNLSLSAPHSLLLSLSTPHSPLLSLHPSLSSPQVADDAMKPNFRELLPYGFLKSVLFFAMKELVGIIGSILKMNVNNDFGLTLKNAVFVNILRQDTEFFDKKQSGILQERLNTDTARLAGDSFDIPADFITKLTFTASTIIMLGRRSARLALIGSATLPFVAAMQFAVIDFYKRIEKKKSSYREMTAASTSETIQEIRWALSVVLIVGSKNYRGL